MLHVLNQQMEQHAPFVNQQIEHTRCVEDNILTSHYALQTTLMYYKQHMHAKWMRFDWRGSRWTDNQCVESGQHVHLSYF